MSGNMRRACVGLTCLGFLAALILMQDAWGQPLPPPAAGAVPALPGTTPEEPKDANDFSHAMTLPTDNKLQKKMEAAQDIINENIKNPKAETWGEAARLLQSLLDGKEDVFVQVKRKDKAGKEAVNWISVRAEANRLLGTMPPQGKEFYELRYGATARARLDDAKTTSNPEILADVARRYLHTKAGGEATTLLGTYHLDRGQFVTAALCFERLLNLEGPEKLTTSTLLKATLSFHRTGDKANAERTWRQLSDRSAREGLRLADQTVTLPELQTVLQKYNQPLKELFSPSDWPMFRGTANRTAQGIGGSPFMDVKWRQSLTPDRGFPSGHKEVERWVNDALAHLKSRAQPVLPAFFPIAINDRIVYRSYYGIHCVDPKTGNLLWEAPVKGSLQKIAMDASVVPSLNQWLPMYQNANPSLLFENSTVGTLSSDTSRVYVVEDLALPPHPNFLGQYAVNAGWGNNAQPSFGPLTDLVLHSKLQAYDLDTGKILWEVGGRGDGTDEVSKLLNDSYFLGPPLPLGGKLYLLAEKNQELRLVCFDPAKNPMNENAVVWSQTLATTRDKILQDVGRRIRVAPLAYGDGIIVCPTNAGAVLGVDLLSHSLIWAYAYREKAQAPVEEDPQAALMRRGGRFGGQSVASIPLLSNEWKPSAPVIQDGKVVFTAPDGSKVFCLNLRDGSLLWNAERKDDLYLAGVYNGKVLLVGKNACRALSLPDGKPLWTVETGLPSGQGIASDNVYYLPLKSSAQTKEPGVCAIDLDKGVVTATTRSRKKVDPANNQEVVEVPGNLIFYEGDVVSQTATELTAFPQLKVKVRQMDELIAKNPKDPVGLTDRGELRLDQGDLTGAIADLRLALDNNPPATLAPKTRYRLYETMTESLRLKFADNEKYLDEYKKLCETAFDPSMKVEDQAKERERRLSNFLCLLAKGREKQGRLVEAFHAYMDFGAQAPKEKMVSSIDERNVEAAPDVWAQGRIAAMIAHATAEQRQPLEKEIAERWNQVKAADVAAMRQFVLTFGSLFKVGKEARLQLAERLLQENNPNNLLEAEQHLTLLRLAKDEPVVAARAVEALARLATRNNLLDDAYYYYKVLGQEFPQVQVREGKTGADYYNDMATDKRFLPYFDEPRARTTARLKATGERGGFAMPRPEFTFEPEGEVLPYFQRHRLVLDFTLNQFKLLDRATNDKVWGENLTRTQFQNYVGYVGNPNSNVRFPYQTVGHLVLINLGQVVFAFDPVHQKKLWERSLVSTLTQSGQQPQPIIDPRDGGLVFAFADNWFQRVGAPGPMAPTYVCLQTKEGLAALDPITGRELWKRANIGVRSHLFGDSEYLYLVEMNTEGAVLDTKALRASDGVAVEVPDFTKAYAGRVRTLGRNLLVSEADGTTGGQTLRLYDIQTGKDLWKRTFPASSVILRSEEPYLAGAVEPDGRVTVVDLRTRQEVLRAVVDPKDMDKVQGVSVLEDEKLFYLAFNGPNDTQTYPWGGPYPNLLANTGMRSLVVNGNLYAFHRGTSKLSWRAEALHQMIVLEQFQDLPMVLMTARYQKAGGNGPARTQIHGAAVRSIDKRTGKLLFDHDEAGLSQFYALHADLRAGRIEFLSQNLKLTHTFGDVTASTAGNATSQRDSLYHGYAEPPAVPVQRVLPARRLVPVERVVAPVPGGE